MGAIVPQVITEDRAGGGQIIDGGLRFDSSKSHRLARTPGSAGNRTTWTWSGWVKRNQTGTTFVFQCGSTSTSTGSVRIGFESEKIDIRLDGNNSGRRQTTAVFRDFSSWYHIVVAVDTTLATASNRIKLYVNGIQQTAFDASTDVSQNFNTAANSTEQHNLGVGANSGGGFDSGFVNGQITNTYLVDGQQLDASYFGYTDALTNTWRPKKFKPQATPNNGTVWSSSLTAPVSGFGGSAPATNAFDNNLSTLAGTNNAVGANLLFTKTFTNVTRLRVFADHSTGYRMRVNGGTWYSDSTLGASANASWRDLTSIIPAGGTITSIEADTNGANNGVNWAAIEVNGVILLDSDTTNIGKNGFYLPFDGSAPIGQDQSGRGNNWTPVNFGGSNTLEKATGALPILNTDGGGKVARVGVRTDSSASSLVLALPLVGIKSDFSNKINSGTTEKVITANGAVATSSYSNFYGGSFDCVGDTSTKCLDIADSADFAFASGDALTVEAWIWLNSTYTSGGIFQSSQQKTGGLSDAWFFRIVSGQLSWGMHASSTHTTPSNSVPNNTWTHVAICRDTSNVWSAYVNGISQTLSGSVSATLSKSGTGAMVGQWCEGTGTLRPLNGYIQDFRLYKGTAKYTQNFIPASTDPDILPDTPSGVAYSSNVALVPSTDGAVASGPTSSYLTLAPSADFGFGTGDFTIEFFVYETAKVYTGESNPRAFDFGATFQMVLHSTADLSTIRIDYNDSTVMTSNGTLFANKWNHIALVRSGSTLSLYINGVFDKSVSNSTNVPTPSSTIYIGRYYGSNSGWINGFISNFHVVKGTALYTSNFTPPTGSISSVANTKLLCCKSNSSATAFDVSPGTITANGNVAATNFNPFTVNINTQRGQESGYCTWNPLDTAGSTLSNGNLNITTPSSGLGATRGTIGVSSGKWYYEHTITSGATAIGIMKLTDILVSGSGIIGASAGGYSYYSEGVAGGGYTKKINNGTQTDYGASFDPSDTISVAFDLDAGTITFYKNGISQGVAFSGLSGTFAPAISDGTNSGSIVGASNFGQKPFKFPPPPGFQPLALANTPRPSIVRPDQYVGVVTYTGTGAARSINTGFKPDLVWIKERNSVGYNHHITDSVRGVNKRLRITTSSEYTSTDQVTSYNSNGFSLGADSAGPADLECNQSTKSYVGWAWKAGGNSNTYNINDVGYATASAAGLTAGTITPTGASVNTKSGFSIVSWTANGSVSTLSHGLGAKPKFVINKPRTGTYDWAVITDMVSGSLQYLYLNSAQAINNTGWGTNPTSSVMSVYSYSDGLPMISYCWAEIPGFSKFDTFVGNNSTDGVYVSLGFRPKFLLVKCTQDITGDVEQWIIRDSTRSSYNPANANLYANLSNAEDDASGFSGSLDLLSNGFKMRGTYGGINASATYIYAAWAESPSFNLYGGQANAR